MLMRGVVVADGVPLKLSWKYTVSPTLARVVEALLDVAVALVRETVAAEAPIGRASAAKRAISARTPNCAPNFVVLII